MRKISLGLLLFSLLLTACTKDSSSSSQSADAPLRILDGTNEETYSVADLETFPMTESIFNEVTYKGVALAELIKAAGFELQDIRAVKASASDGYSVNYDSTHFHREDVIVAYATVDGPLSEDDGTFRMVLPGEEGKLNIRFLVELRMVP